MNIYVGNLHTAASEEQLRNLFKKYGKVNTVKIIMNMETGLSRGFGFVEMDDMGDGSRAIKELNSLEFMSQALEVSEAMAQPQKENKFLVNAREKKTAQSSRGGGANRKH